MKLTRQPILPGFESGEYESRPAYNRAEFEAHSAPREPGRRGNHINIRLSTADLDQLHQLALREGVPVQSFIAGIVHRYLAGELTGGEMEVPPDSSAPHAPDIPSRSRY